METYSTVLLDICALRQSFKAGPGTITHELPDPEHKRLPFSIKNYNSRFSSQWVDLVWLPIARAFGLLILMALTSSRSIWISRFCSVSAYRISSISCTTRGPPQP